MTAGGEGFENNHDEEDGFENGAERKEDNAREGADRKRSTLQPRISVTTPSRSLLDERNCFRGLLFLRETRSANGEAV